MNQRLSEINSAARGLYQKLFAEIDPFLDRNNISRIILVPHRTAHFIPFEALHDGNQYLIERYSFSSIPAATVTKFLKTKNSKISSALIIGNPHVTYDTEAQHLPGAEKEARAIAENFNDRHIIMGLDASETEFYKNASSYDILHFACHGLMDSRSPMNSKLYLARDSANDGYLTTKELYGANVDKPGSFTQSALLARRLVERGVRMVQIMHRGWDSHGNLPVELGNQCMDTDQACAALITDLKQRGMLEDTLVVWGGEFGRTVYSQGKLTRERYGRDHHPRNFCMWMAGGGIKGGVELGETDEYSYNPISDPVHINEINATILHCMGIDHERFTLRYQGLDQRLTGVESMKVIKQILA